MTISDDSINILPADDGPEGTADAGAGQPADPSEQDGGADGGADTEGPMDAGAGQPADPHETDGGADGGA